MTAKQKRRRYPVAVWQQKVVHELRYYLHLCPICKKEFRSKRKKIATCRNVACRKANWRLESGKN